MMSTDREALPPIIAFSRYAWGGIYNSIEPRLTGLASRGWTVLHSNGPLNIWERDQERWRTASWLSRLEKRDGVLLDRTGRWPFRWERVPAWDDRVTAWHARRLRRAVSRSPDTPVVAYLFHPRFVRLLPALEPVHVVFQVIDNYAFQPGWTLDEQAMLEALVERADLILLNNGSQGAFLPGTGPGRGKVASNAVDLGRIAAGRAASMPADLSRIPSPRIGYIGMINANVDFELIAEVAAARPDWHWVLIGPIRWPPEDQYPEVCAAWRRCEQLPNVHFLGPRPRDTVPAYLTSMDVNTMCYRMTAGPWTQAAYPLKVLECLAAAKPVVSAPLTEVMRHRGVIDFPSTHSEWIRAIERGLQQGGVGTPESRVEVARANSWDRRIDKLDRFFRESLGLLPHSSEKTAVTSRNSTN